MSPPDASNFHTFMDFDDQLPPGIIVPQKVYAAPAHMTWRPLPCIKFLSDASLGLSIQKAIVSSRVDGLQNAHTNPSLAPPGVARITLRIIWPGYEPWVDTDSINLIKIDPTTSHHMPCTWQEVTQQVARRFLAFFIAMRSSPGPMGKYPDWHISRIPFAQLYLVELRNVSPSGWQPVISYEPGV
ncbi:hypothetical protein PHLGIDRAFT_462428 [Phlebiopsis gigantea 11061_1 CR5-6]|uniref:Uncharacterized protein n=1 Tax=Phlebiopsis gigantea (strain 11061_1 CR5-6) TaxID=745531 RepID=A0A0C3S9R4_PHLG1|nr:hypothetical protein PHLGIDRAFT_462428 [Phlebiopsis gigantea 11061_1 CR5-6]